MAYLLLWLFVLGAGLSCAALGWALAGRVKNRWVRAFLGLMVFLPLSLAYIFCASWAGFLYGQGVRPWWVFPWFAGLALAFLFGAWLVRRRTEKAEQPGRPTWPLARLALYFTVCLCGSAVLWFHLGQQGREAVRQAYEESVVMAESVHEPCPGPKADATPFYKKAGEAYVKDDTILFSLRASEVDRATAEKSLSENQKTLEYLHQAVQYPWLCAFFDPRDLWYSLITRDPFFDGVENHFRFDDLLYWEAVSAARGGDFPQAKRSLDALLKISAHLRKKNALLPMAFSCSFENQAKTGLEAVLAETKNGEFPIELPVEIPETAIPSFKKAWITEMAFGRQSYYWMDNGHPDELFGDMAFSCWADDDLYQWRTKIPLFVWRVFYAKKDLELQRKSNKDMMEALSLAQEEIHEQLKTMKKEKEEGNVHALYVGKEDWLPSILPSYFNRALGADAERRLCAAALACTAFLAQNRRYPDSLKELVPVYLERIPTDPFDSTPLKMEKVPGGLRLYCAGRDYRKNPIDFYLGKAPYEELRAKPRKAEMERKKQEEEEEMKAYLEEEV